MRPTDTRPEPPKATLESLAAQVAGRSVAIIGSARSLQDHRFGPAIDSHDLVVRCNRTIEILQPQAQGRRTDILVNSTTMTEADILRCCTPSFVLWATPKREKLPLYETLKDRLVFHPLDLWQSLFEALGQVRPTTGLMAVNFFANVLSPSSVHLYGFDYTQRDPFYAQGPLSPVPHDFQREARLVRLWFEGVPNRHIHGYRF